MEVFDSLHGELQSRKIQKRGECCDSSHNFAVERCQRFVDDPLFISCGKDSFQRLSSAHYVWLLHAERRGYSQGPIAWHSNKKQKYFCTSCKRTFPRMEVLLQHFRDSGRHRYGHIHLTCMHPLVFPVQIQSVPPFCWLHWPFLDYNLQLGLYAVENSSHRRRQFRCLTGW